jgi:hypothetical protein
MAENLDNVDTPDRMPLTALVGASAAQDFMYMGAGPAGLHLYKHIANRCGLNIDGKGQTWRYQGGGYAPVDRTAALAHVGLG